MKLFSSKYAQPDILELFRRRLFYISAFFVATAEISDLFLMDLSLFFRIANSLVAGLIFITIILYRTKNIRLVLANSIVIYILLADLLYSSFMLINAENYETLFLRLTVVVCAIIPYAAFTVNKYHAIFIGVIFYLNYLAVLLLTGNSYLIKSFTVLTFVLIALVLGIYILTDNLMAAIESQINLLKKRDESNKLLKEQRKRLMEAVESKNKLFSIISHDLKDPFNGIIGMSQVMKIEIEKGNINVLKKYNTLLQGSAEKAYLLLLNLLDWSNTERNTLHFAPRNIRITKVMDQVIELLQHNTERKEITITQNIPKNFTVYADKNMMASIFRNLITNALKFTGKKGQIMIDCEDQITKQLIFIKDSGKGMSQNAMNKLFSNSQVHSERGTENEGGSGLGLTICKEFIHKHNGEIWVEKNPDVGLTFYISLPQPDKSS